jgi:hypothetical protein
MTIKAAEDLTVELVAVQQLEEVKDVIETSDEMDKGNDEPETDLGGVGLESRLRNVLIEKANRRLGINPHVGVVALETRAANRYTANRIALESLTTTIDTQYSEIDQNLVALIDKTVVALGTVESEGYTAEETLSKKQDLHNAMIGYLDSVDNPAQLIEVFGDSGRDEILANVALYGALDQVRSMLTYGKGNINEFTRLPLIDVVKRLSEISWIWG